jgi:hypothetical protein
MLLNPNYLLTLICRLLIYKCLNLSYHTLVVALIQYSLYTSLHPISNE